MATNLIYMPTFRSRQQENIVLRSFDFGNHMYPLIEIIKEFDRKREGEKQQSFKEIHLGLIKDINAQKVFVDMPVYLKERASMKDEVLLFSRTVITNKEKRTDYLLSLAEQSNRIIPVISSFLNRTGETETVSFQEKELRPNYKSIAYRVLFNHFEEDWAEIIKVATTNDYIILDLDTMAPYPSPPIKQIISKWSAFSRCPKIVLRSAINTDIQNVNLTNNEVVFDADNGLLEQYKISFKADSFGDYVGIKKDDLTSGGTISPGMLLYDAINNQFIGFKGLGNKGEKKSLSDFEIIIVPEILASVAVKEMKLCGLTYLNENNKGWEILNEIKQGAQSGQSQAKFKRIAMEHYLHCLKTKIDAGQLV
ncbi:MAG: hypothetical protein EHM93_11235 [Bacteroidales bacterium]|nr:MAG: hypothetical protein EHM93_11235 [Bacteroidales bacterium]